MRLYASDFERVALVIIHSNKGTRRQRMIFRFLDVAKVADCGDIFFEKINFSKPLYCRRLPSIFKVKIKITNSYYQQAKIIYLIDSNL